MSDLANPYEAPLSVADETSLAVEEFIPATRGLRFANYIIDRIAWSGLQLGGQWLIKVLLESIGSSFQIGPPEAFLINIFTAIAYYILMEATCGRTLGKLATGTKVVDADGRQPSLRRIIIRTLIRCIPFEPFSFLGKSITGWHDRYSNTYVVKA